MNFDRAGFDREVAKRLQLQRKSRGITQEALAARIGLLRTSYANLESGRQRIPLDVIWRAAVILGVPIAALVPEPIAQKTAQTPVLGGITGLNLGTLTAHVGSSAAMASTTAMPQAGSPPPEPTPSNVRPIRRPKHSTT